MTPLALVALLAALATLALHNGRKPFSVPTSFPKLRMVTFLLIRLVTYVPFQARRHDAVLAIPPALAIKHTRFSHIPT